MGYADLEKARECHAALREIFIHHPGGWADKEALHKAEKLAWQAMTVVKDAECQEKMGIVEHYAASLYSESEHHQWRMSSLPGADFLRLQATDTRLKRQAAKIPVTRLFLESRLDRQPLRPLDLSGVGLGSRTSARSESSRRSKRSTP